MDRILRLPLAFSITFGVISLSCQKTHTQEVEILSSWLVSKQVAAWQMQDLAKTYEVVRQTDEGFVVYVPESKISQFQNLNLHGTLIEQDIDRALKEAIADDPTYLANYRNFQRVQEELYELESQYPEICQLIQYGESYGGQPLLALKVSDNVTDEEEEPQLMLTATTHGDEIITTEVVMELLKEIVGNYTDGERFQNIVDGHELYFIPVVSPEGYVRRSRYTNGVDPNREYPWPERPLRTPIPTIQNEMDFFNARNFVGSLDFHASGQMVMYPWGYTYDRPESDDLAVFDELSGLMADENQYVYGQISRVIYVAKGSSADYWYMQNDSLSLGIELTTSKAPHSSRIPEIVAEAREMTYRFIEYF